MQPASTSSTAEASTLVPPDPPARPVFIGIDWADQAHAICLIDPERPAPQHSSLAQKPEAIAAWAEALHKKYAKRELCLIIETSKGALITALIEVGGFTIYPINPKQAARYREALHPTGGKSDPADAQLLATFLMLHRDSLRRLQPDTPETRKMGELTQLRRTQVEERKRVTLQLRSLLQKYFPLILDLFQDQLDEPLVIDLLKRWPSLLVLKRVNPSLLNTFFKEHGIRSEDRREELVKQIRAAVDLTRDKALIEPLALRAQCLARLLEVLVRSIAEFDKTIADAVAQHEDAPIFKSLPGAGAALVPRLIVAFGSDRERYESATELQNRHACPQFLKQTFHEFADQTRRWSPWAKAFYNNKKASGMKHQAAVRALAFKWIRILFQMWKHRTPYDAHRYTQALSKAQSPLAKLLSHTTSQNPEIAKNVT
jgi:transposase